MGVWNNSIIEDGADVEPSLAVQVKSFIKVRSRHFISLDLIWIFTQIEKCQGHHTLETVAIHHFTSNCLRLHCHVSAESLAGRHPKSRWSFFKCLSWCGGHQPRPRRQRHWFIMLPQRQYDPLAHRCPVTVPARQVGSSPVLYQLLAKACSIVQATHKQRESKQKINQMSFGDTMRESWGWFWAALRFVYWEN